MQLPPFLQWLKDKWMIVGHAIGFVMSRIILTAFWIVGVGIYAVLSMLRKREKETPHWEKTPETSDFRFQF